jgi:hypothetical protein
MGPKEGFANRRPFRNVGSGVPPGGGRWVGTICKSCASFCRVWGAPEAAHWVRVLPIHPSAENHASTMRHHPRLIGGWVRGGYLFDWLRSERSIKPQRACSESRVCDVIECRPDGAGIAARNGLAAPWGFLVCGFGLPSGFPDMAPGTNAVSSFALIAHESNALAYPRRLPGCKRDPHEAPPNHVKPNEASGPASNELRERAGRCRFSCIMRTVVGWHAPTACKFDGIKSNQNRLV